MTAPSAEPLQTSSAPRLWKLGERESGTARLEEAVTAWDDCLSAVQSAWPAGRVDDVRAHQDAAKAEIKRRSAQ